MRNVRAGRTVMIAGAVSAAVRAVVAAVVVPARDRVDVGLLRVVRPDAINAMRVDPPSGVVLPPRPVCICRWKYPLFLSASS